jgi:rare lipoprotein A
LTARGPEAGQRSGKPVALQSKAFRARAPLWVHADADTAARTTLALALCMLTGCASIAERPAPSPSRPTVLPARPPNVNQIPDAVPRYEPRSAFGNPPFYDVDGRRYFVLGSSAGYVERGIASWYGTEFHGLRTATGESYDMFAMTAAHKTLPLPCYARVTNLSNGRSVVVRINDRGPFVFNRIIDLSYAAAAKLEMIGTGTAFVQVETLTPPGPLDTVSVSSPAAGAATAGLSSVPAIPSSVVLPRAPTAPTTAAAATAPPTAIATPTPPAAGAMPGALRSNTTPAPLYIQVGAFARPENATRVRQRLRAAGFDDVITLAPDSARTLTRVRIGPIASVQQYDQLVTRLARLGFPGAKLAQD